MYNPLTIDPVDLFTAQALTASGGATPSLSSAALPVGKLSRINVYVQNAGASTDCTIAIKGSPTSAKTLEKTIQTLNLNASTVTKAGMGISSDDIPAFIWATITNNHAVNAATITVELERFR